MVSRCRHQQTLSGYLIIPHRVYCDQHSVRYGARAERYLRSLTGSTVEASSIGRAAWNAGLTPLREEISPGLTHGTNDTTALRRRTDDHTTTDRGDHVNDGIPH